MLTRSELPENPVTLAIAGGDGEQHFVTTERTRGGRIRMACSCAGSAKDGWCRHQIELLCMRYDDVVGRDEETEFHFEDIVMGTPLADDADEVDMALGDYESACQAFDAKRPAGVEPDKLKTVAELAEAVAEAAQALDRALDRFRKRLAGACVNGVDQHVVGQRVLGRLKE
jgi:hypothetical protein